MTDRPPNLDLAERFAALVVLVSSQPSAVMEQRDAARAVIEAAKAGEVRFALADGALLADGAPFDSPLLASRFAVYGLEELAVTERATQADLLDLARVLAAAPGAGDQVARFAARQIVIDPKSLPRRLRARAVAEPDAVPPSAPPNAPAKRVSGSQRRQTPVAQPAIAARPSRGSTPGIPAVPAEEPEGGPMRRRTPVAQPVPAPSAAPEPRDVPERLVAAIAMPETQVPALAGARDDADRADTTERLASALDRLVTVCDLAFRQGRHDDLIESLTTLVALEFRLLERDSSDARRQALNHAVRQLAKPVLLRQLAVLRHSRSTDPVAADRLQQVLYRFGIDGAEAVIDEFASAPSDTARATCLECLRGLRRTYDALLAFSRDPRESVVRQTAHLLGELREPPARQLLVELLQHPDARTRRAAVSALAEAGTADALGAVASTLTDESPMVRSRAVAALVGRREPEVLRWLVSLIGQESDREVLYSAIAALGTIPTAEAVQALIPIAEGEGANALKKSAAMRIQACTALAIIRAPAGMAAVQALRADRDRDVREASVRLVAQAQRRTSTTGIPAVSGP
ncbi:MAG: HEAT repeat domain-containing protein [Gemmatimonadetes bacterium]|nr:HEAT repeat domain-containing protein [Gemmatimonadota bacterium]